MVLHVVEAFGGGVQSAINDWISNAPNQRHIILRSVRQSHDTERNLTVDHGVLELPTGHWARVRRLTEVVRRERPDIVHAHSSIAGVYARIARLPGTKLYYSPHCFAFERTDLSLPTRALIWMAESVLSLRTDRYIVVSERERRLLRRFVRQRPSTLVPVVPARIPEVVLTDFDSRRARSTIRILATGRLTAQKDPTFLAHTIDLLPKGLNAEVTWVGDGDEDARRALEARRVRVTGWVTQLQAQRLLAAADIFVHTAAWEGSPVVIDEAMSLGLPIAARRIPVLVDRGLTHLADTPGELAAVVVQLTMNADLRIADGHANRERFDEYLTSTKDALSTAYSLASVGQS